MKKFPVLLFVAFAFVFFCGTEANAQTPKFGHINTQDLFNIMPERDSVQKKLEAYAKDMGEIYEELVVEYRKKMDEFEKNQNTWSETVKQAKQKDLIDYQRRIQEQQQTYETGIQEQQQKLYAPLQEKVRSTIAKVAKANGLIYVFEIAPGASSLLYFNETQSTDILPLVKKEMGITK